MCGSLTDFLDVINVAPFMDFEWNPTQSGVVLQLTLPGPSVDDPHGVVKGTRRRMHLSYARLAEPKIQEHVTEELLRLATDLANHEFREWFKINGEFQFDPHGVGNRNSTGERGSDG